MRISGLKKVIKAAYAGNKQPVMIWGAPGVGKSESVKQAAVELKIDCIDLRLSLLESIDLRGLPTVDPKTGDVRWAPPVFLPRKGKGILFIDEIVQGSPSMQAAASQLILDRRIGEYVLPEGWMVVAAGNRLSDRAATAAMPKHIANRFVHLYAEVDTNEWLDWADEHGIDVRVRAFIKFRPTLLHQFDPAAKGEAFASPRSWEFASNMLSGELDRSLLLDVLTGTVGAGPAAELIGFIKMFESMTDPDDIIADPDGAPLASEPSTLYAVTTALAGMADKSNIGAIVKYFGRISDSGRPEFSVRAVHEITRKNPGLCKTAAFITWATKHNAGIVG
jgi:hypothetical protein